MHTSPCAASRLRSACSLWLLTSLVAACGGGQPVPMALSAAATAQAGSAAQANAASAERPPLLPVPRPPPLTAADSDAGAAADCGRVTQMADVKAGPVDIVWIVDGSPSMLDEIAAISDNLGAFANTIGGAGIDYHVVMLAPLDPADQTSLAADAQRYRFVTALVDSHNALQLLLDQYADYADFLRPAAALHFIVVSDDDSFLPADDFQVQMRALAGKAFTFHAIASEDVNGLACVGGCGVPLVCGGAAPGTQYYALADATGGQKISICTSDWSAVFGPLQKAVIESAPLPCQYAIPAPPAGEALDMDKVNLEYGPVMRPAMTIPRAPDAGACQSRVAWFYDDPKAPKQIRMCPAACSALSAGGVVNITLGCETVPVVLN